MPLAFPPRVTPHLLQFAHRLFAFTVHDHGLPVTFKLSPPRLQATQLDHLCRKQIQSFWALSVASIPKWLFSTVLTVYHRHIIHIDCSGGILGFVVCRDGVTRLGILFFMPANYSPTLKKPFPCSESRLTQ